MISSVMGLLDKVKKELSQFTDIAVVGMSGGADSTLVATLCAEALGRQNVYGIGMPYNEIDENTFNSRSAQTANRLGINYSIHPIGGPVDVLTKIVGQEMSQLNQGNIRARMRMIILYSKCTMLAEKTGKRCRVIGTGNLSEDFIGYDTKGGDALADLFPIGSLFKSEVYQLLEHFSILGVIGETDIDRKPSAGLWEGQTDEGELGHSYNEMEKSIKLLIENYFVCQAPLLALKNETNEFVRERHINNKHKHEAPRMINLREFTDWQDQDHLYGPFWD